MKTHDKFIETYKELENLVRDKYETVRAYEEQLPEDDSKKLQICRINRNYIQHNADYNSFISISSGMQEFLENLVEKLHCENGVLKDHMISVAKYGCIFSDTDTVLSAAESLSKKHKSFGIVINKKNEIVGLIRQSDISNAFGLRMLTATTKLNKLVDMFDKDYSVKFMLQTTSMDIVNADLLDNGSTIIIAINKAGTFVGVYNV